jgi:hypothetical protein
MAETIVPVVHGERRSGYRSSVLLHVVGATLSAALLGAGLAALGMLLGAPWGDAGLVFVAAVAVLYALRVLVALPVPIPALKRQVPDWWRAFFSPRAAALMYGLGLGVGFLTFLSAGTLVAVAAAALASGSPLLGAALCAPFGVARGLSVMVSRRAESPAQAAAVVDRLERVAATPLTRAANLTVLLLVAGVAASAV